MCNLFGYGGWGLVFDYFFVVYVDDLDDDYCSWDFVVVYLFGGVIVIVIVVWCLGWVVWFVLVDLVLVVFDVELVELICDLEFE